MKTILDNFLFGAVIDTGSVSESKEPLTVVHFSAGSPPPRPPPSFYSPSL